MNRCGVRHVVQRVMSGKAPFSFRPLPELKATQFLLLNSFSDFCFTFIRYHQVIPSTISQVIAVISRVTVPTRNFALLQGTQLQQDPLFYTRSQAHTLLMSTDNFHITILPVLSSQKIYRTDQKVEKMRFFERLLADTKSFPLLHEPETGHSG